MSIPALESPRLFATTRIPRMKIRAMRVQSISSPDFSLAGVTNPLFWFLGRILEKRLSETRSSQRSGCSVPKCRTWLLPQVVCSQGGAVYSSSEKSNTPIPQVNHVIARPDLQNPLKINDQKRSFRCPAFRPSRVLFEDLPPVRIQSQLKQIDLLLQY